MNRKNIKIAVVGGDVRQLYLAKELSVRGYETSVFGMDVQKSGNNEGFHHAKTLHEAADGALMMILPLPFSRDNITLNAPLSAHEIALSDVYAEAEKIPYIAAGLLGEAAVKKLSENSALIDYARREEFALANAFSTVEGALAIAISEMPITLRGSVCAVTGYGRIGKILVRTLLSLGARVKVFARKNLDRISAKLDGGKAYNISEIGEKLSDVDLLINTVPSVIIDEKALRALPENAVIIELASAPGGIDRDDASKLGIRLVNAQSLPGKYSPASAAKTILESIFDALSELEVPI